MISAFPLMPPVGPNGTSAEGYPYPENGMTLRDWFAGQALAGFCADSKTNVQPWPDVAAWAYGAADAMMDARRSA